MPKLLQINVTANWGSTGKIAEDIGKVAMSNGWESYIAYGRDTKPKSTSNLFRIGNNWDMYYHGLQSRIFDKHGLASTIATKDFIEKVKLIEPDIIHLHNIHGYYINYKVLFKYLATINTPIIWTLHDCWPMTGHCAHFDAVGCNKWKTGCNHCPLKSEFPKSLLFDNSSNNHKLKKLLFSSLKNVTIVPVSKWLANIVSDSYLSCYNIHTISNGIDINIFKKCSHNTLREKLAIGNKTVLLGVATTWNEKKGLNDFIRLSKALPEKFQIILVGIDDSLKKKLPNNIITIKKTNSQQELAELYSMAEIVLNLSYEETFGLTTVEGFACGTPGIVYNKTASPELITPETGIVVKEAGNTIEIIEAINKISNNGKEHYTAACRARAINCYNKDDKFYEYIKLYNSLLAK